MNKKNVFQAKTPPVRKGAASRSNRREETFENDSKTQRVNQFTKESSETNGSIEEREGSPIFEARSEKGGMSSRSGQLVGR